MQEIEHNNINGELFAAWLKAMDWNKHGGQKRAAEALGKTRNQIERYQSGAKLSHDTRLAMTAIAEGLRPWDAKTGGTPAIHLTLSMGRH